MAKNSDLTYIKNVANELANRIMQADISADNKRLGAELSGISALALILYNNSTSALMNLQGFEDLTINPDA